MTQWQIVINLTVNYLCGEFGWICPRPLLALIGKIVDGTEKVCFFWAPGICLTQPGRAKGSMDVSEDFETLVLNKDSLWVAVCCVMCYTGSCGNGGSKLKMTTVSAGIQRLSDLSFADDMLTLVRAAQETLFVLIYAAAKRMLNFSKLCSLNLEIFNNNNIAKLFQYC